MFRRRVRRRTVGLQALTILRLRFCHLDRSLPFGLGRASAVERPAFRRRRFISRFRFREFSPRNHKCFRCTPSSRPSTSSEYFPFLKYSGAPPASPPRSFVTAKTKPAVLQTPSPLPPRISRSANCLRGFAENSLSNCRNVGELLGCLRRTKSIGFYDIS